MRRTLLTIPLSLPKWKFAMSWRVTWLSLSLILIALVPALAGESLSDPEAGAAPAALAQAPLPDEEAPGTRHVVAPGETPAGIAARRGIDLETLERANPGLDARRLAVGRVLVIPPVRPSAPPPVAVSRPGQPGEAPPLVMDFR